MLRSVRTKPVRGAPDIAEGGGTRKGREGGDEGSGSGKRREIESGEQEERGVGGGDGDVKAAANPLKKCRSPADALTEQLVRGSSVHGLNTHGLSARERRAFGCASSAGARVWLVFLRGEKEYGRRTCRPRFGLAGTAHRRSLCWYGGRRLDGGSMVGVGWVCELMDVFCIGGLDWRVF